MTVENPRYVYLDYATRKLGVQDCFNPYRTFNRDRQDVVGKILEMIDYFIYFMQEHDLMRMFLVNEGLLSKYGQFAKPYRKKG